MQCKRILFHAIRGNSWHLTEWRWCVAASERRRPAAYWRAFERDLALFDRTRAS